MRHRVVLYNPRSVFWTMPLALIAIGSALDPSRFEVVIIDGRLERDPLAALASHIDGNTVCIGVTVLTGAPIHDALGISRRIKKLHPALPVIWGGWHPSLFPEQCLAEPTVDAAVIGQGEVTFAEMVQRLLQKESLRGLHGCAFRHDTQNVVVNAPRQLQDINEFPAHNYDLADTEQYFQHKERRQFDYVSSQGCRFRCSFCADPTVFKRGWFGLAPERVSQELAAHQAKYRFTEVSFQDETFFTSPARVEAIAEAILQSGLGAAWTATMRSDQGSRLDDRILALCRRSGLRRVMIGVESGSPDTLRRIFKDISLNQVYQSAEKCARHRIGAIFNFIVGFPNESDESVAQTLSLAAQLSAMSPDFDVSIFYYRPYPGTQLAEGLTGMDYKFVDSLEAWANFDYVGGRAEWVTDRRWRQVERFKFYRRHAFGRERGFLHRPLRLLSRWRIEKHAYTFPVEKLVLDWLRPAPKQS